MDVAPTDGPAFTIPPLTSTEQLLASFEEMTRAAREALDSATDEALQQSWTLKRGGATVFTMPRAGVLRTMFLNHLIHHRGQLSVYLRLLDVPLPRVYGPSADEPF
jgi:uncharacterized damage-inducible protein DinB